MKTGNFCSGATGVEISFCTEYLAHWPFRVPNVFSVTLSLRYHKTMAEGKFYLGKRPKGIITQGLSNRNDCPQD